MNYKKLELIINKKFQVIKFNAISKIYKIVIYFIFFFFCIVTIKEFLIY